jgi:acetyl-CoA acetyltransferase
MEEITIVSAVRTPIGRYMGAFKDVPAYNLGALVLNTAIRLTTLLHEMKRRNVRYDLETICGGGRMGIAAVFERK